MKFFIYLFLVAVTNFTLKAQISIPVISSCGGSLEFDNTNSSLSLPSNNQYYSSNGFTWECWFKLNSPFVYNNTQRTLIRAMDNVVGEDFSLCFGWYGVIPDDHLTLKTDGPSAGSGPNYALCDYAPTGGFLIGTWYHVAGVMDYKNSITRIYVNGQKVDSIIVTSTPITRIIPAELSYNENTTPGFPNQPLGGNMDEVRIWNIVRTDAEILASYNQCLLGNETNLLAYYRCNQSAGSIAVDATSNHNDGTLQNGAVWSNQHPTALDVVTCGSSVTVNSASICSGSSTILTANGADTYSWSPSTGLSGVTGSSVTATPAVTITYTVIGTNTCGISTVTSTVTVISPPIVKVNSATICSGSSTILTANGADTYSWSPSTGLSGVIGLSITATPTVSTTYTVIGTNTCGISTAISTVTVISPPIVKVNSATICAGSSITLIASGANSYSWSPPTGLSSETGSAVTSIPIATITYTVTGTAINGCVNSTISNVTIITSPVITVNSATICVGSSTTLTASGADSFLWSPSINLSNSTNASVIASPLTTTTYTVIGTEACGTDTALSIVSVNHSPIASLSSSGIGCQSIDVIFTGANGKAPYVFTYQLNGMTQPTISSNDSSSVAKLFRQNVALGTYTCSLISLKDANNCSSSITNETTTINVYQKPTAIFSVYPERTTILEPLITITNASVGANLWNWNFGDSILLNSTVSGTQTHSYKDTGTFMIKLIATTQFGCIDSTYQTVIINLPLLFYIPNAFSPNGDGKNDTFTAKGEGFEKFEMMIFDRWGNYIFCSNNINIPWDGKANGGTQVAQSDTYVYVFQITDMDKHDRTYRGTVTLLK